MQPATQPTCTALHINDAIDIIAHQHNPQTKLVFPNASTSSSRVTGNSARDKYQQQQARCALQLVPRDPTLLQSRPSTSSRRRRPLLSCSFRFRPRNTRPPGHDRRPLLLGRAAVDGRVLGDGDAVQRYVISRSRLRLLLLHSVLGGFFSFAECVAWRFFEMWTDDEEEICSIGMTMHPSASASSGKS